MPRLLFNKNRLDLLA